MIFLVVIVLSFLLFTIVKTAPRPVTKGDYVTTPGSKYCYLSGYEDSRMKDLNKIYYQTLTSCGKKTK